MTNESDTINEKKCSLNNMIVIRGNKTSTYCNQVDSPAVDEWAGGLLTARFGVTSSARGVPPARVAKALESKWFALLSHAFRLANGQSITTCAPSARSVGSSGATAVHNTLLELVLDMRARRRMANGSTFPVEHGATRVWERRCRFRPPPTRPAWRAP